jgi:hypothetical protein
VSNYVARARAEREYIAQAWPRGFPCADALPEVPILDEPAFSVAECSVEGCEVVEDLADVITTVDDLPHQFAIVFCGRHAAIYMLSGEGV